MIGTIALLIVFWAMTTAAVFAVFAEDVVENQRCGRSVRAGVQTAAIVLTFPILAAAFWLLAVWPTPA